MVDVGVLGAPILAVGRLYECGPQVRELVYDAGHRLEEQGAVSEHRPEPVRDLPGVDHVKTLILDRKGDARNKIRQRVNCCMLHSHIGEHRVLDHAPDGRELVRPVLVRGGAKSLTPVDNIVGVNGSRYGPYPCPCVE